jgi:hypothetical protein
MGAAISALVPSLNLVPNLVLDLFLGLVPAHHVDHEYLGDSVASGYLLCALRPGAIHLLVVWFLTAKL